MKRTTIISCLLAVLAGACNAPQEPVAPLPEEGEEVQEIARKVQACGVDRACAEQATWRPGGDPGPAPVIAPGIPGGPKEERCWLEYMLCMEWCDETFDLPFTKVLFFECLLGCSAKYTICRLGDDVRQF